ncbi:MFS transporter [Dictyobacter alpinus]|uniref:MFS transporter n=1 Tax=Dictyobacter alpinus TaxID=2014873 RepID=A0A402BGN3_9CHLR|nr:MFS transporter [Dictyobacter alpinus]GCE30496.1 MFS transporter [Dictyobacter alpinus]
MQFFSRARFHYSWIIAGVVFLALLAAAGMRSTPSVLLVPLEHEFSWSPATVSLAVSINLCFYGLSGPFVAAIMERFGIRRVMVIALLLIALAAGATVFMREPWQLDLLWGLLVGLATGAIASVLGTIIANRWFVKRRGLVLGLFSASNATGQLVFLPVLASLAVTFGWRSAALTTAAAALVVVPLVAIFMRERPQDMGLPPYGSDVVEATDPASTQAQNPFRTAIQGLILGLRSPDFWLLAGSFFICGATTNGLIGTHLIPASMDHGITEVTAASLLALIGIFDLIGTTVSGWLSDRVDNRWLLCWYYGLRGCALLLLPYALGSSFLYLAVFIVFYGLDWVATVPPTARLATEIFGIRNAGVVYGWIFASHQLGAATAAFSAGLLRTWLGSYQVSFISAGLLCLCASGMVIRIGRRPRVRKQVVSDTLVRADAPVVDGIS